MEISSGMMNDEDQNVGNKKLPQLPRVRGGMSGQQQQKRMHAI